MAFIHVGYGFEIFVQGVAKFSVEGQLAPLGYRHFEIAI